MPRKYQRKTDRATTPADVFKHAAERVAGGQSIRSVAEDFNINRMTLKRYKKKQEENHELLMGYEAVAAKHLVIPRKMEKDLADHIKLLANMFHGLSPVKCRELAYEFAFKNKLKIPDNWLTDKRAGPDWWAGFKSRNSLAIRSPEATSFARATAFNRPVVNQFYDNLMAVIDKYGFKPEDIYNVDETGCTTVQNPETVVAEKGQKQVGSLTSGERGELVTTVYAIGASGNVIPPMFIFPRVNYRDHFIRGAPAGAIGNATRSGWMNEELFLVYLKHLIRHTRCSKEQKILVIFDNHDSHISLQAVDLARDKGIVMLTLPPHTSHPLQPLDRSVYGPFKKAYNRAMDAWMRSNPGKTVTIYEIPSIVNDAHMVAMTPANVLAGFRSTGIFPYNRDLFTEIDFAAAVVTDREMDVEANQGSTAEPNEDPNPNVEGHEGQQDSKNFFFTPHIKMKQYMYLFHTRFIF